MPDDEFSSVDAVALRRLLDGDYALVREHVRAVLARREFVKPPPRRRPSATASR